MLLQLLRDVLRRHFTRDLPLDSTGGHMFADLLALPIFIQFTNPPPTLKVGGGHRSGAKVGGTGPAQSAESVFWSCRSTFLALKAQLVVSVSAIVMVSTVWSVSCLPFFYSRCPCAQPFVKVGARAPRAPWSRRHFSPPVNPIQCKILGTPIPTAASKGGAIFAFPFKYNASEYQPIITSLPQYLPRSLLSAPLPSKTSTKSYLSKAKRIKNVIFRVVHGRSLTSLATMICPRILTSFSMVDTVYTWFPALRCRFRNRFRNRFRKNCVRTCRSVCRC